jgi:pyruvate/2-oxoglutarate dehydrogenase complex dihydrolipoamide acyltransferase (E2) component
VINIAIFTGQRVIDGVAAARFLADLVQGIEMSESILK